MTTFKKLQLDHEAKEPDYMYATELEDCLAGYEVDMLCDLAIAVATIKKAAAKVELNVEFIDDGAEDVLLKHFSYLPEDGYGDVQNLYLEKLRDEMQPVIITGGLTPTSPEAIMKRIHDATLPKE